MDPIPKFNSWYEEEIKITNVRIPSACCLSTTGTDGYPNARFVSLKDVKEGQFIITSPLNSRKGKEIEKNPRAALTFWWANTEKQIRVQGDVKQLTPSEADYYFSKRPRDKQLFYWASHQGEPIKNSDSLTGQYNKFKEIYEGKEVPRPKNWGGFKIKPVRIEFLVFKENRFHDRMLFIKEGEDWRIQKLQP